MKITKIIVGVSLIATSIFASDLLVKPLGLNDCKKDMFIGEVNVSPKGDFLDLKQMKYLDLNPVNYPKIEGSIKSFVFFKNGFIFDKKIYKFENEWSQDFLTAISDDYRISVVCGIPTNNIIINSIESAKLMDESTHQLLSSQMQKEITKYFIELAIELNLNNSLGGFEIGNNPQFMVANISEPEFKTKIDVLKNHNENEFVKIINQIKKDEQEASIKASEGKLSVSYISDFFFNKAKKLDLIAKGL